MKLLLMLAAGFAAAGEPSAPPPPQTGSGETLPINLHVGQDAAELAFRGVWRPTYGWALTPFVKGGALYPFGSEHLPYSVMDASPFLNLGLKAAYSGPVESMAVLTLGDMRMRSHKGIEDAGGVAASPANSLPDQERFSKEMMNGSLYADLGYIHSFSRSVKAAFFAAADGFALLPGERESDYAGDGFVEANTGAILMAREDGRELSVTADLRLDGALKTMYRNTEPTVVPAAVLGAEYARETGGRRVALGVDTVIQRADTGVRPYVSWQEDRLSAILAAEARKSRDPFFPDSLGGAAEVRYAPYDGLQVGVLGDYTRADYSMAPAPEHDYRMMVNVSGTIDKLFKAELSGRTRARQARRPASAEDSQAVNGAVRTTESENLFRKALAGAETMDQFVKSYPVRGTDGILAAVAAFTASMGDLNYNNDESRSHPNVDNAEELYRRARASALTGTEDPILVCIGAAQLASRLAVALGEQAGVPIEAAAVTVWVPDEKGAGSGHAVATIKTKEYGIVFVDWGRLTPTRTWDTKMALRVYQALQGIPKTHHYVSGGSDGRLVGYFFSEEGKDIVRHATFHGELPQQDLARLFNDDPRGHQVTTDRFRTVLRSKFSR